MLINGVDFINLTPHTITMIDAFNNKYDIKSSGVVRCEVKKEEVGKVGGFSVYKNKYVPNLDLVPQQKENTIYLVSSIVAQAFPERNDFYVVNDTFRNEDGVIIGCKSLAKIV